MWWSLAVEVERLVSWLLAVEVRGGVVVRRLQFGPVGVTADQATPSFRQVDLHVVLLFIINALAVRRCASGLSPPAPIRRLLQQS